MHKGRPNHAPAADAKTRAAEASCQRFQDLDYVRLAPWSTAVNKTVGNSNMVIGSCKKSGKNTGLEVSLYNKV